MCGFTALFDELNVNKQGTIDDMSWVYMALYDIQYQLNNTDQSGTNEIEIMLHY